MKNIVLGILAHVDSGKTTLSEALMYRSGAIRTLGRVDHKDTHLDTDEIEKKRGITVFSKQARFPAGSASVTLLDTPGHVDFSAETERTLQVLDYAILLVSAPDGIQAHTETLWKLLARYEIPVFLFVNKADLPNPGRQEILTRLQTTFNAGILCPDDPHFFEDAACLDEDSMDAYLNSGVLTDDSIQDLICRRKLFPCFFGSALKLQGIDNLLAALSDYTVSQEYPAEFGAKVYKILRDPKGERLTCLKVLGGRLSTRDSVCYLNRDGERIEEKVTGIRLYSGEKYTTAQEVLPGTVCTVSGLQQTQVGFGLGTQSNSYTPLLEPYMTYSLTFPQGVDAFSMLPKLRLLEEEDPALHIEWDNRYRQIHARIMGEVQIEVLHDQIQRRFDTDVLIGEGKILYRETIRNTVEGIGHYEPLRHYAEVHLLLRPLSSGEGLHITTHCSTDQLDLNWQRLILTHLAEKTHLGVLTGSPITDLEICLMSGKSHEKHTEGGDFRQATYRAVRHGLMQAESVLLEPVMTFQLEVPQDCVGRAMQDLHQFYAVYQAPVYDENGNAVISGTVPVSTFHGYDTEVRAYTKGRGMLSCFVSHYAPCHNQDEVIAALGYRPEEDLDNTPDSVFCSHGAGIGVKWNEVTAYMHLPSVLEKSREASGIHPAVHRPVKIDEKELEAIMEREFGPISRKLYTPPVPQKQETDYHLQELGRQILLLDGYNLIFASPVLSELAETDLDDARNKLMDLISNYTGVTGCESILVFDAYKVKGGRGERFAWKNISVVYTKENETCDMYIERLCHSIGKNDRVRVVTSDGLIQLSALRAGVNRTSSREFLEDAAAAGKFIKTKSEVR